MLSSSIFQQRTNRDGSPLPGALPPLNLTFSP